MENFLKFYKKKAIVDTYDLIRLSGIKRGINREIERIIIASLVKGKKILEVGCGTGFITKVLAPKGEVIAIDASKEMISRARKNVPTAEYINKNLFLYSPKKKFDSVVAIRVLGHFQLENFEKAYKLLELNSRPQSVLAMLVMSFARER